MNSQLLNTTFASLACWTLGVLPAAAQQISKTEPAVRPQVMESYGKLPLSFEANQGQTDRRVKFLSHGSGYTLFLTEDSAVLSLHRKKANAALRMKLLGANAHAVVTGAAELPGKSNYFAGNDPKQWRTNVPSYASVKYTGVYPGIDLVYHGNQQWLEYDFVVAPGADPRLIDLRFQGAKKLRVNRDGALVLRIGDREVIAHPPVVYQEVSGKRQTVPGRYILRGKSRIGFTVPEYDKSRPLVIDPTLVYSTYLGGSGSDEGFGIAVDTSGNVYVTGRTYSQNFPGPDNFPTTPNAFGTNYSVGVGALAFVTKLNVSGSALVYSTYLGGDQYGTQTWGSGIAVDSSGSAYVTGGTDSPNFPTTGAFQPTLHGYANAFVTKLNASGTALAYSTYLGGSFHDQGNKIAVDDSGNAYVTGMTSSADFPTTLGAFQRIYGGGGYDSLNAFVTKLNAAGSALVYSTYLGGSGGDGGNGLAVDALGNAYVTGFTFGNFPTTPGAFQTALQGSENAFVTKLNPSGSALVYSSYLGGNSDYANCIAIDDLGNAYITGDTQSSNFPVTPNAYQTSYSGHSGAYFLTNAFVTKLNAAGSSIIYSTYLGGNGGDNGNGIAVDALGNAYVTGTSFSANFPVTADGLHINGEGVFLSKLNVTGSGLVYSTSLGGGVVNGIAVDVSGSAYIVGYSSNFPTTPNAFQPAYGGGIDDAFVAKLNMNTAGPGPVTEATLSGPAGHSGWYFGAVTITLFASAGGSPVSATYYSVDSGPYRAYGAPFSISSDGTHQVLFYSVDTSGNQETPHGQTIKIDATAPASHVNALPATAASPNFRVQWSGTDATSGLLNYSIFVSDNTGPFAPWLNQTTATQAWFAGSLGHTYRFYCSAQDLAGNVEIKTAADATTFVPQMPGDANGDGKINCADLAIVKASMGKSAGQTGFDPRADVNHDGVVNVLDLAIVSQKLIPGTTCP